jgi:hypothetical protein
MKTLHLLALTAAWASAVADSVPFPPHESGSIPAFDPGSELVSWNGQHWNITNQRLFGAEYEKYLSTPEANSSDDKKYREIIGKIQALLAPANASQASLDAAFALLSQAAGFDSDGNFSDVLSNQIYLAWLSQKSGARVDNAVTALEAERKRLEWNLQMAAGGNPLSSPGAKASKQGVQGTVGPTAQQATVIEQLRTRLAEVTMLLKASQTKTEINQAQARSDFQVLLVQLFLQRRFEHVIIGTKFYRSIFPDGAGQVRLGEEAMSLLSKTSGSAPSLATLDAAAREMIQKVRQGVQAFQVLLDGGQLDSANKRLSEAFSIGQYLPDVSLVPLAQKMRLLTFVRQSNQLVSSIDSLDYTEAAELVGTLKATATDLDLTKATAAIRTAQVGSDMHLAKARNAAVSGDKAILEAELKAAAEIWPTNPKLAEMAAGIFSQSDVQSRALADFDQLAAQKNYRLIFDDKMRFIAAVANQPDQQARLSDILEKVALMDKAILQASEIEKHGDYAGAWEVAETAFSEFPEDNKLNQVRAGLTIKAAAFVDALSSAKSLEARDNPASALAAYLEARKLYPNSHFAHDGILRVSRQLIPDAQ